MKFIHLADVHLGAAPDRGCAWSTRRGEEIWDTFRRVFTYIRDNPVDLLFIAGDLFHRQPLLRELKEVNYLFASIPGTKVFLIAGNHDYLRRDSMYRRFTWAENVHFFMDEEVSCVDLPELGAHIYGFSYHRQEIPEELLSGLVPGGDEGCHILLAHGGDDRHVPMNYQALAAAGFDYIALGHIHRPGVPVKGQAVFCGALEPIDRNDTGRHGFVEGKTDDTGRIRLKFVPFALRSYKTIGLTLTEDSTQTELEERVREEIDKNGSDNIYRILLDGIRPPELVLIPERFLTLGNVVDFRDKSRLSYDLELLERVYGGTLIGEYIRAFRQRKRSDVEEKALMHGLQALLETSR